MGHVFPVLCPPASPVFARLQPAAQVVTELRDRRIGISEGELRELGRQVTECKPLPHRWRG